MMNCLISRKKARVLFVTAAGGVALAGCSMAQDHEMGQEIQMGPFTFEVRSASPSLDVRDTGRVRVISVTFRVLKDESRPRIDFGEFLSDMVGAPRMMVFPHTTLVDSHGHKFKSDVRGTPPRARFLITSALDLVEVMSDAERLQRFNDAHLETQPSDYRLIIDNPERRKGQPRAVRIQLQ